MVLCNFEPFAGQTKRERIKYLHTVSIQFIGNTCTMFLSWTCQASNSQRETSLGHGHACAKLQLTNIRLPFYVSKGVKITFISGDKAKSHLGFTLRSTLVNWSFLNESKLRRLWLFLCLTSWYCLIFLMKTADCPPGEMLRGRRQALNVAVNGNNHTNGKNQFFFF